MVHKYKVGKLKTLSFLANSQTSQLQTTEFAFLGLIQRLARSASRSAQIDSLLTAWDSSGICCGFTFDFSVLPALIAVLLQP